MQHFSRDRRLSYAPIEDIRASHIHVHIERAEKDEHEVRGVVNWGDTGVGYCRTVD